MEATGDTASGAVGTIIAAGVLRASFILLRGSHPHGQCNHAERMATIRAIERDVYGDVYHSEDILEERGQERTSREDTRKDRSLFRIQRGNKLGRAERANRAFMI